MSQNSLVLATAGVFSGLTEQGAINGALDTLASKASGGSAPSSPIKFQYWMDTSGGVTAGLLKMYDGANWVIVGAFNETTHTWTAYSNGAAIGGSSGTSIEVYGGNYEIKVPARATTTTSEALADTDRGKRVTFSNASAVAVSSVAPDSTHFAAGWSTYLENINDGEVTWTPTTATINGGSALKLRKGEWALVRSDGSNFTAWHTGRVVRSAGTLLDAREIGTRSQIPNLQNGNYSFTDADFGNSVLHDSASAGHTWTIQAQTALNAPLGAIIGLEFLNGSADVSVAITTDSLIRMDGTVGTGARTFGANSFGFIKKLKSAVWGIGGKIKT